MSLTVEIRSLLNALEEPALIIQRGMVVQSNEAARLVLGAVIEGTDVRLAIRHPEALEHILPGKEGSADITGIGELGRPWTISIREVGADALLVRMTDRSAAAAAEKMRVDFVANASHELRTPLSTIIGYAETLADEGNFKPDLCASFSGVIRGEAKRMLRIIEDLMSLSRIEAERFVAPTDPVDVAGIILAAARNAGPLAEEHGCSIETEVEEGLPALRGDRAQLLQLLDNLVTNAVRYGCGERGCMVRLSASSAANFVAISVTDSGPGIPAEHLHRVTERFYRVDAGRSRHSGGTGLGLSIAKHIVERHKGTIQIRSEVGQGTAVIVKLPAAAQLSQN